MRRRAGSCLALAAALILAFAGGASAQSEEPIGRFAVDLRAGIARYGQNEALASINNLSALQLPSRGYALDLAAHVYLLRWRAVTVGVGGSIMTSRGTRTPEVEPPATPGPSVRTRFTALNPQLSLNFGKRDGWSYISGGLGTSTFAVGETEGPAGAASIRAKTLNYGGGARWFNTDHLAFALDVRFYAISPTLDEQGSLALPRMTLLVVSAGVAFK